MKEKTNKAIEAHIERIIQATNFENFKKIIPNGCPCNLPNSKLCHELPESKLNCFLCYCPEYKTQEKEGGCNINSKKGKWFYNNTLETGRIWDCSNCDYPQQQEVVRNYLKKIFGIQD